MPSMNAGPGASAPAQEKVPEDKISLADLFAFDKAAESDDKHSKRQEIPEDALVGAMTEGLKKARLRLSSEKEILDGKELMRISDLDQLMAVRDKNKGAFLNVLNEARAAIIDKETVPFLEAFLKYRQQIRRRNEKSNLKKDVDYNQLNNLFKPQAQEKQRVSRQKNIDEATARRQFLRDALALPLAFGNLYVKHYCMEALETALSGDPKTAERIKSRFGGNLKTSNINGFLASIHPDDFATLDPAAKQAAIHQLGSVRKMLYNIRKIENVLEIDTTVQRAVKDVTQTEESWENMMNLIGPKIDNGWRKSKRGMEMLVK